MSNDRTNAVRDGLFALDSLLDQQLNESRNHPAAIPVKEFAFDQRRKALDQRVDEWASRLESWAQDAFQQYMDLMISNPNEIGLDPVGKAETRLRAFLEPRLGHALIGESGSSGSDENVVDFMTGGEFAHKNVIAWVADVISDRWVSLFWKDPNYPLEIDEGAAQNWQAPVWMRSALISDGEAIDDPDGLLSADDTRRELATIHNHLWASIEEGIRSGRRAAQIRVASKPVFSPVQMEPLPAEVATPVESSTGQPNSETFSHSEDFRMVTLNGQDYAPTAQGAKIVKVLYQAHCDGKPYLASYTIMEKIEKPGSRLIDSFRSNPAMWKALVRKTSSGLYGLNIRNSDD